MSICQSQPMLQETLKGDSNHNEKSQVRWFQRGNVCVLYTIYCVTFNMDREDILLYINRWKNLSVIPVKRYNNRWNNVIKNALL